MSQSHPPLFARKATTPVRTSRSADVFVRMRPRGPFVRKLLTRPSTCSCAFQTFLSAGCTSFLSLASAPRARPVIRKAISPHVACHTVARPPRSISEGGTQVIPGGSQVVAPKPPSFLFFGFRASDSAPTGILPGPSRRQVVSSVNHAITRDPQVVASEKSVAQNIVAEQRNFWI